MNKLSKPGRLNSFWREGRHDRLFGMSIPSRAISTFKLLNYENHKLQKQKRRLPNIDTCFFLNGSDMLLHQGY